MVLVVTATTPNAVSSTTSISAAVTTTTSTSSNVPPIPKSPSYHTGLDQAGSGNCGDAGGGGVGSGGAKVFSFSGESMIITSLAAAVTADGAGHGLSHVNSNNPFNVMTSSPIKMQRERNAFNYITSPDSMVQLPPLIGSHS